MALKLNVRDMKAGRGREPRSQHLEKERGWRKVSGRIVLTAILIGVGIAIGYAIFNG